MAEGAKRCIVHQLSKSKGLNGGFWLDVVSTRRNAV
jgi:hypothetical protein